MEKSTGTKDEGEAWARAREMESVARGIGSVARFRDRMDELNRQAAGLSVTIPSLREWSAIWMETKRVSVRPETAAFYQK